MSRATLADILLRRTPSAAHVPLRVSELTIARDLQGFTLATAAPDVRGWHVIASDQQSVGTVTRLIVEMRTSIVRYLIVELAPGLERRSRPVFTSSVMIPIGLARRVDDLRTVPLERVTSDALRRMHRIPPRPITRLDEEETLRALGLPPLAQQRPEHPYAGAHFSTSPLFDPPAS